MLTILISLKIDLVILVIVFQNSKIRTLSIDLMIVILLFRQLQKAIINRVKFNIQPFINFRIVFINRNNNKLSVRFSSTITTTDFFRFKLNEVSNPKISTISLGNSPPPLSKLLRRQQTETCTVRSFTNLINLINLFGKTTIPSIIIELVTFNLITQTEIINLSPKLTSKKKKTKAEKYLVEK